MKYMVLRVDDERSSDLCKRIEAYALDRGGLEFPFSFGSYYYDSNTLNAGLATYGESYTKVFHENCRCSLVPISDEVLWKVKPPDNLDMQVMISSPISDINLEKAIEEDEVTKDSVDRFSSRRVLALLKLYLTKFA